MRLRHRLRFLDVASFLLETLRVGAWLPLEAEKLEIVEQPVPLPGLKAPIRLLQLSDFHASRSVREAYLRRAVEEACALRPDLICLTGDFTTSGLRDWSPLTEILRPLAHTAPTFAVLGNHDGTPDGPTGRQAQTRRCLAAAGITLLENRGQRVSLGESSLYLVGTGDIWCGPFDLGGAFANQPAELPTVLLTHNPDARDVVMDRCWDLMLCGHTHGGQINLPGLTGRFTPVRHRDFIAGHHVFDGRVLYINRGIGAIGGVRLGARPEITLFTLG
ncbi:MAG: phosphodiesterase YaeI [Verrucomicrobiota bacterium]